MHTNSSNKTHYYEFFVAICCFSYICIFCHHYDLNICSLYNWSKVMFSFLFAILKLSKMTYPQKLFRSDCITLYALYNVYLGKQTKQFLQ